jgi:KUP system potassium uptake protein
MERPDIPVLLQQAHDCGCQIDLPDIAYYVGHESIVSRADGKGWPKWIAAYFALLQRNSAHLSRMANVSLMPPSQLSPWARAEVSTRSASQSRRFV